MTIFYFNITVPLDQYQKTSFLFFPQDHEFQRKHHKCRQEELSIYLRIPSSYYRSLVWWLFCFWWLVNHKRHQHFMKDQLHWFFIEILKALIFWEGIPMLWCWGIQWMTWNIVSFHYVLFILLIVWTVSHSILYLINVIVKILYFCGKGWIVILL